MDKINTTQAFPVIGFPKNCLFPLDDDPSSVSAMLRGRGDKREKLYERFAQHWHNRRPNLTEDEICAQYRNYAFEMELLVSKLFFRRASFRRIVWQLRVSRLMMGIAMRMNIYEIG